MTTSRHAKLKRRQQRQAKAHSRNEARSWICPSCGDPRDQLSPRCCHGLGASDTSVWDEEIEHDPL